MRPSLSALLYMAWISLMSRRPISRPPPEAELEKAERTDPGGPSPDVLAQARREATVPGPGDATLVYDKNKGRPRDGERDS